MYGVHALKHKTSDLTTSILDEELQIIAEIERLEQLNAEFNNIDGIDGLFVHRGRSDSQLLDEMIAEFGLDVPDFDIFNYVDPALDASLDSHAAETLDTIDDDLRQSGINLNSFAGSYAEENCEQLAMLKLQLKQQQEMIFYLNEHLNVLTEIHCASSHTLFEEGKQFQYQTQVKNNSTVDAGAQMQFRIPEHLPQLNGSVQVTEVRQIESVQFNAEERHDRSVFVTQSKDDVALNVEPHPSLMHKQKNYKLSEGSLRMKMRITWNGDDDDKEFTVSLIGNDTSPQTARDIQKRKGANLKRLTSAKKRIAKDTWSTR